MIKSNVFLLLEKGNNDTIDCVITRPLQHDIAYGRAVTNVGHRPEFELTKVTPFLALMGELWGVCCGYLCILDIVYSTYITYRTIAYTIELLLPAFLPQSKYHKVNIKPHTAGRIKGSSGHNSMKSFGASGWCCNTLGKLTSGVFLVPYIRG